MLQTRIICLMACRHQLGSMEASPGRFQVACSCWPSFLLWDAVPPWSIGKTAQMKVGFK